MSEAWNGPESVHYVDHADRHDRQLAPITALILDAAAIRADHDVLDVGCGSGAMTLLAAQRARSVVGLDISHPLVQVAISRAEECGATAAEFIVGDAQVHPFEREAFDSAISQFGLMFFDDPPVAFSNLRGALRPGGRLVFACWRGLGENDWLAPVVRATSVHVAVPDLGGLPKGGGMFAFKNCDEVAALLESVGFTEVEVAPVSPTMLIGGGGSVDETAEFLLGLGIVRGVLGALDDEQRAVAEASIRAELDLHHDDHHEDGVGVRLGSGVWLVSAAA